MNFCPSFLSSPLCLSLSVSPIISLLSFSILAWRIFKKESFIENLMESEEFFENQQLIERYKLSCTIKMSLALLNSLSCFLFVFILILFSEEFSLLLPLFFILQGLKWIGECFLSRIEYNKQGKSSFEIISMIAINALSQGIIYLIIYFIDEAKEEINEESFIALLCIEALALSTFIIFVLKRNDFTQEALYLQKHIAINFKNTRITDSLLSNDYSQKDIENVKEIIPSQTSQISSQIKEINKNACLSIPNWQQQSITSDISSEESEVLKDISVIGYKVKEDQLLFVISYQLRGKKKQTMRAHRDFKYLSFLLQDHLKNTMLTPPHLPKKIKEIHSIDKNILKERIQKLNRFLFYLEHHQIQDQEIFDFLLPVKQKPFYKPVEIESSDAQSLVSESDVFNNNEEEDFGEQNRIRMNSDIKGSEGKQKIDKESRNRSYTYKAQKQQNQSIQSSQLESKWSSSISATNEIEGKTFYTIQLKQINEEEIILQKRYQHFKEFHQAVKSELKSAHQLQILIPELPYKPSPQSKQSVVEYRIKSLTIYLQKVIINRDLTESLAFNNFISSNQN